MSCPDRTCLNGAWRDIWVVDFTYRTFTTNTLAGTMLGTLFMVIFTQMCLLPVAYKNVRVLQARDQIPSAAQVGSAAAAPFRACARTRVGACLLAPVLACGHACGRACLGGIERCCGERVRAWRAAREAQSAHSAVAAVDSYATLGGGPKGADQPLLGARPLELGTPTGARPPPPPPPPPVW